MANAGIGVQGVGLARPQPLYPRTIRNQPSLAGTNGLALAAGQAVVLPAGTWLIKPGKVSLVQIKDPVTNTWRPIDPGQTDLVLESDGENFRVWNPTGFPVGAVVTNAGTGYTSAPTVAASIGGSAWSAVVGGGVSAINLTSGGGVAYEYPPIINIAAPPQGGVPATAVAAISGGVIRSITMIDNGAGYGTTAPEVVIVPHPLDNTVTTQARATAQLSFVGQVTAVLCTDPGTEPLAVAPALTFTGGGGTNAAATAVMAFGVTNLALSAGSGFGAAGTRIGIFSHGGMLENFTSGKTPVAAAQNPAISTGAFLARSVRGQSVVLATGLEAISLTSGIFDPGLHQRAPDIYAAPNAGTAPTVTTTLGGVNDTVFIQPLATQ